MEVFREKSNYEGVVSVYEAMKTRGVTPGAKVFHLFTDLLIYLILLHFIYVYFMHPVPTEVDLC